MAQIQEILVPDIGGFKDVEIIEIPVAQGDAVEKDDPLIILESDKATLEVPSPHSGTITEFRVKVGDRVSQGSPICAIEVAGAVEAVEIVSSEPAAEKEPAFAGGPEPLPPSAPPPPPPPESKASVDEARFAKAHASPSVRRFARELGADLAAITGTGPRGRILKDDVQAFIKKVLETPPPSLGGLDVPDWPDVDFARFGEVEATTLTKIKRLSGAGLHRNWVRIPHVTHQDEADVTDLESFRKEMSGEAAEQGAKLTMVAFLLKASAAALLAFPEFNASLDPDGETLILKKYVHIGVAVDTPDGLVVPVIRDVDKKGLVALAREVGEAAEKARARKLSPEDMSGGCFTISSLGGIGGVGFTPIINAPEVAILGASRAKVQPVFRDGKFVPRRMLPLSLSYDHRVIDGAGAARFAAHLAFTLGDVRRLVL